MEEVIEEIAQELVYALESEGQDDLVSRLVLLLGDYGYTVDLTEGGCYANPTH